MGEIAKVPSSPRPESIPPLFQVWSQVLARLESQVPPSAFNMWLRPLSVAPGPDQRIEVRCPNLLGQKRVQEQYAPLLSALFGQEAGRKCALDFVVDPHQAAPAPLPPAPEPVGVGADPDQAPVQLPLPRLGGSVIPLNPRFTFHEFITGRGNEMAYAASRAIADQDGGFYANVMCLTAGTGLGKSHLTQAVGNHLLRRGNGVRVCYTTAEDFTNEMVVALKQGLIDEFKDKYRHTCDVLLLEGVTFLAGKPKVQAELAYTLDVLVNADKRIVLTSSRPPRDIPKLEGELTSRFSGGVVISIDPPDEATRGKILSHKARRAGLDLPDAVVAELARGTRGDVRQLEAVVVSLAAQADFQGRPIDLDLAREVLDHVCGPGGAPDVETIKRVVCRTYRLSEAELVSKSRYKRIVVPRNLAMYFTRRYTEMSFAAIGEIFGREHATVMHSVKRIERQLREDQRFAHQAKYLQEKIEAEGNPDPAPS